MAMASNVTNVFEQGNYSTKLISIDPSTTTSFSIPPPKPLLIATPIQEGHFPILILLHGYLLYNNFYSQLILHIASHGYIVLAPQLYTVAGPDSSEEIRSAAALTDWISTGLAAILPKQVLLNTEKIAISGHSRGGKVAFALALGHAKMKLSFSALIAIDPVDGMDKGKQTNPPILTYVPHSFDLKIAAMVIGSGLGGVKKNSIFPACAPKGVSHEDFYSECCAPAWHFVAKDYGHMDMLDDETEGFRGKTTYCLCKNGRERKGMRSFVGGIMVAFMKAYLEGDDEDLMAIRNDPKIANIEISSNCFL
ncbi:Chlorophyllase protein [Dioscorea alata]|uniref:Chlorophyllase protein n=1 Tax=Dioscorea alata TaxID=55571 RepID=A0ACB7TYR3_DIOAL|nr:Chlorophyllase protein [Dioscorea alata]